MQKKARRNPKNDNSKKNTGNTSSSAFELTDAAQEIFSQVAKSTSRVVEQAASILEEEIAAGIVAARKVEDKFIDTKEIRSEDKQALFSRFRVDAHDVVDIVMDIVSVAAKYGVKFTKRVITIAGPLSESEEDEFQSEIPKLKMPQPLKPGSSTEVPMILENRSEETTDVFSMFSTDLISNQGKRIGATNIRFNPQTIKIGPLKKEEVMIKVTIPKNASTGNYSGLVQATNMDQLRAILILNVE